MIANDLWNKKARDISYELWIASKKRSLADMLKNEHTRGNKLPGNEDSEDDSQFMDKRAMDRRTNQK